MNRRDQAIYCISASSYQDFPNLMRWGQWCRELSLESTFSPSLAQRWDILLDENPRVKKGLEDVIRVERGTT